MTEPAAEALHSLNNEELEMRREDLEKQLKEVDQKARYIRDAIAALTTRDHHTRTQRENPSTVTIGHQPEEMVWQQHQAQTMQGLSREELERRQKDADENAAYLRQQIAANNAGVTVNYSTPITPATTIHSTYHSPLQLPMNGYSGQDGFAPDGRSDDALRHEPLIPSPHRSSYRSSLQATLNYGRDRDNTSASSALLHFPGDLTPRLRRLGMSAQRTKTPTAPKRSYIALPPDSDEPELVSAPQPGQPLHPGIGPTPTTHIPGAYQPLRGLNPIPTIYIPGTYQPPVIPPTPVSPTCPRFVLPNGLSSDYIGYPNSPAAGRGGYSPCILPSGLPSNDISYSSSSATHPPPYILPNGLASRYYPDSPAPSNAPFIPPLPAPTQPRKGMLRSNTLARSYNLADRPPLPLPNAEGAPLTSRNLRAGYWNKRGDHLTSTGYVKYAPREMQYPDDLRDYPDVGEGYQNDQGLIVEYKERPELHDDFDDDDLDSVTRRNTELNSIRIL